MRSPLWDDHTTWPKKGWTSRRHRIRAFGPAPSGDLIHHPHEADGVSSRLGALGLATDLLHHGHKVRGVGLGSECVTPRSRHNTSTKPNLLRPRDRQTWRFVSTARYQTRAVSHPNRSPPARPTPVGVTDGSRGSSAATTPGPRAPNTFQALSSVFPDGIRGYYTTQPRCRIAQPTVCFVELLIKSGFIIQRPAYALSIKSNESFAQNLTFRLSS
jgi:hypothetical protein